MRQPRNTAIVIPVYNHADQVAPVVRSCVATGLPTIVVNDGSDDRTGAVLARLNGFTLLVHEGNRGKGAALLTGFAEAVRLGCRVVITIDGDGQHVPEDLHHLVAAAEGHHPCMVIGTRLRMEAASNVPWTSRFGRVFSNFWVRAAGGPTTADSQSGFRLYPLPQTLHLGVRARRYQFEVEVLVRARWHDIPVLEVPVRVVYPEQRVSHFHPWRDFWRNSSTFAGLFFANLFRGRRI